MKMEIPITAEVAGTVTAICIESGAQVDAGQVLAGIRKEKTA